MIGSGTVSNDVATFTTTTLPVGTNSITATYVGDANYLGSTSTPATVVTVSQDTTTTTVTFSPTLPVSGAGRHVDGHDHAVGHRRGLADRHGRLFQRLDSARQRDRVKRCGHPRTQPR